MATNYEIYRRSTLGLALTDALDELIQNNQLSPPLAMKVLYQFDKTILDILTNRMRTRGTLKGHLNVYRYLDGVWTFIVDDFNLKLDDEQISGKRLKIVACDSRKSETPQDKAFVEDFHDIKSGGKMYWEIPNCKLKLIFDADLVKFNQAHVNSAFVMYTNRAEYDRGVNTFSPEGRLFQVEYAIEAIKLGSTAIGIQAKDGVLLAVEKRLTSPLMVPGSIEKIFEIDRHIGCACSGLTADARMLVEHARIEAQHHTFVYDEKLKVESLTQAVCDLALRFGETGTGDKTIMSRPFGVALLVGGMDENGPQLFFADPSGTFTRHKAKAIGSAAEAAQNTLQNEFKDDLTLQDAEQLAVRILKEVMEEKMTSINAQLAKIDATGNFHIYTEAELAAVLEAVSA